MIDDPSDGRLAIVLAAGKGTRMKSDLPKVLFPVNGRPMIEYVFEALRAAGVGRILVVVGYRAALVQAALADWSDLVFVEQTDQRGTGHAVMMCQNELAKHDGPVLVVTGDSPLTQASSVAALFAEFESSRPACVLGTLHKANPTGLGRIVRNSDGRFVGIIEESDATDQQRQITEVNMSTYVFDTSELVGTFAKLRNDNRQSEYYVTDCPGIMISEGKDVRALDVLKPCEAMSVNTVAQLALVERELKKAGR